MKNYLLFIFVALFFVLTSTLFNGCSNINEPLEENKIRGVILCDVRELKELRNVIQEPGLTLTDIFECKCNKGNSLKDKLGDKLQENTKIYKILKTNEFNDEYFEITMIFPCDTVYSTKTFNEDAKICIHVIHSLDE